MWGIKPRVFLTPGILAILLAGLFAGRQAATWPARLLYPGEEDEIEGMRLAEMVHLRQGVPIYAPASPEAFDAALYGPLYYLVGARLVAPEAPAYLPLRILSSLGTLVCAAGCALLAFWLFRSFLSALLAPLIFLAYAFVTWHGTSARSDSVALALCFSGFLIAFRFRNSRALLLSIPPILLGLFYKPQFVAGLLAVLLFLLLEKRYRAAAEFAVVLFLGGLAFFAYFQLVFFPRQALWLHLFAYNRLPFEWGGFTHALPFFALMFAVPLWMAFKFLHERPDKLVGCYATSVVALSLLTVAKKGGETNYFIECALVLSSLGAALLAEKLTKPSPSAGWLGLLVAMLFFAMWYAPRPPQPADLVRDRAVQEFLRREFPARSLAVGFYTGDLLRAGLATPVSDIYQYSQLVRAGRLSDRDLPAQLSRRRFRVITLNFDLRVNADHPTDHLTGPIRRAILENYQVAASLELPGPEKFLADDRFYAWVPRAANSAEDH
jgi:hypothetical protein